MKTEPPHQVQLDDGTWVQIARNDAAACGELSSAAGADGGESWVCDRLQRHEGPHVACVFHEGGRNDGKPEEVVRVWIPGEDAFP